MSEPNRIDTADLDRHITGGADPAPDPGYAAFEESMAAEQALLDTAIVTHAALIEMLTACDEHAEAAMSVHVDRRDALYNAAQEYIAACDRADAMTPTHP